MRKLLRTLLQTLPLLLPATFSIQAQSTAVSYRDVIVMVNDSSIQSQEIARYFGLQRGIPEWHVFHFALDTTREYFTDSATFTNIRFALQDWMRRHNLVDSIQYIVTTKGCPLVVSTAEYDKRGDPETKVSGYAAFDAALSLINGKDSSLILQSFSSLNLAARQSRYFGSTVRFKRDPDIFPLYLVSRLDGYTVDDVKRMIDSAAKPVSRLEGMWLFDLDPTFAANGFKDFHNRTEAAAIRLRDNLNLQVFLDPTNQTVTGQENVLWYFTWGPFATGNVGVPPHHSWVPGSIGMVVTGLAGQTFNHDTTRTTSLLFAELISEGMTGGATWSLEPYAFGIPYPEIVTDRYAEGWNLAEAFFAATPLAGFRTIVVGDPKMKLSGLMTPEPNILSFDPGYRFEPQTDTGFFRNDNPRPITVTGMRIADADDVGNNRPEDFSAALPQGKRFPITVKPDDSLVVLITSTPTIYGGIQAKVEIDYTLPGAAGTGSSFMPIVGSGKRPGLDVAERIYFGIVPDGGKATEMLRIRNLAKLDTLLLNGMTISGDGASRFSFINGPTETLTLLGSTEVAFDIEYFNNGNHPIDQARVTINSNSEPATRRVSLEAGIVLGVDERGARGIDATNALAVEVVPTPTSGEVTIHFDIPAGAVRTTVEMLDVQGNSVANLFQGTEVEGKQSIRYDASEQTSGVYYCRVRSVLKNGEVQIGTTPLFIRK